jgi:hypothetical protein
MKNSAVRRSGGLERDEQVAYALGELVMASSRTEGPAYMSMTPVTSWASSHPGREHEPAVRHELDKLADHRRDRDLVGRESHGASAASLSAARAGPQ